MAKFCGKCGTKLDEQTGKCPNCEKEIKDKQKDAAGSGKKTNKKRTKTAKEKNKAKKVGIVIAVVLAVIIIGFGAVCFLVYSDKLDIPCIDNIFVSMGLKDEDAAVPPAEDPNEDGGNSDQGNIENTDGEEIDLGDNYEVPAFDAEKYFKENTDLKSSFDVLSSQDISTEREARQNFAERGFTGNPITYEYTMDGTYCGTEEISSYSSSQHPMYQTYYMTASGDVWMILEVNGAFFASPISYNFTDETKIPVTISETDTITSYDSTTNKFYINVPKESQAVIKTVERIDAETLEKLTGEEIDKL